MPKIQAPAISATPDEELPQTAVKPRQKDLLLQQMEAKLAEYQEPSTEMVTQTTSEPNTEEETFKKRYSDLRRHAQQKEAASSKKVEELTTQIQQLTIAQNQPLPKTREEFEAWKAKYPDIVGFIEIIAEERANAAKQQVAEELNEVKSKLSITEKEKAYATLKVLVPDLEEIVGSETYQKWFGNQPMFVQELLNTSDDPHQIAYYMQVYKKDTAPVIAIPKSDKLRALDTAVKSTGVTPNANSGKWKFTQSQIQKMTTEQYTAQETEILAARAAGQIMDDLSKRNSVFDV